MSQLLQSVGLKGGVPCKTLFPVFECHLVVVSTVTELKILLDSTDMNLGKFQDRGGEALRATVHGISESDVTQ